MAEYILALRVYYEDTDAIGVVYHSNYLKYFERAKMKFEDLVPELHAHLFN